MNQLAPAQDDSQRILGVKLDHFGRNSVPYLSDNITRPCLSTSSPLEPISWLQGAAGFIDCY